MSHSRYSRFFEYAPNLMKSTALLPVVLVLVAPAAHAQSARQDGSGERRIEEIIVTVERREQSLQDLPGTGAVLTGEELKRLGISNVAELDGRIPGLSVANNAGNIEVYIRGIGSSNNTELGDPAAATHLDGVYVPRPSGFGSAFFDIQRVEVNVGPQGTLRGRNATAGSVNVLPIKPGIGVSQLMAEASVGNYGEQRYEAMANLPLFGNSAFRIAAFTVKHDSYYTNVNPSMNDVPAKNLQNQAGADGSTRIPTSEADGIGAGEAIDNKALRASYLIDGFGSKLDGLSLGLTFDYIDEGGTGYTGTNYSSLLGAGLDPQSIRNPRDVYMRPITPELDTVHYGFKAHVKYEAERVGVELISSFRDLVYEYKWGGAADTVAYPGALGGDGTPFNFDNYSRVHLITDSESTVNELRLFSTEAGSSSTQWAAGVFLFNEKQKTFLGGVGDRNQFFAGNEFNQRTNTDTLSFYGDATYSLSDKLRVTGGVRYTQDEKQRTGVNARYRFVLGGANYADTAFTSVGTPGFQFKGLGRTIINPDVDGNNEISDKEAFDFYLDGIAEFGERDGLGQVISDGPVEGGVPPLEKPLCPDIYLGPGCFTSNDDKDGRVPYAVPGHIIALQNGSLDNDFIDWRVRFEYDAGYDNLLYGLISTGHKSGGFNDNVPDVEPVPATAPGAAPTYKVTFDGTSPAPTYGEEQVTLFEFGSKNEFTRGEVGVTLNFSAFYYDYKNLQVTNLVSTAQILSFSGIAEDVESTQAVVDANASDNIVSFTFNASDAAISGFQLEGGFDFPGNINFDYTLLWLREAKIKKSRTIQDSRFDITATDEQRAACLPTVNEDVCDAQERPIEGHRLPRTPKLQFNSSISKVLFLNANSSVDAIISLGYRSAQHMTVFNGRIYRDELSDQDKSRLNDRVSSYWTMDFGAGFTRQFGEKGEFRGEFYLTNVTDQQQEQAIIMTQRDNTRFFSAPRTYGLRFRAIF